MMATVPSTSIIWPFDESPDEVETRDELDYHIAHGSLAGLTVQGLRMDRQPPDLSTVDLTGTLFVGCRFADRATAAGLVARGALVVPVFDVPYPTGPARLYTPEDLAAGFDQRGFAGMYDTVVFEHFRTHGGAMPDTREALAQRLHDGGINDALSAAAQSWVSVHGRASTIGLMGGHAEQRGSAPYRLAATLAHELARAGRLVLTGGGPGVMEAANLGSYLAGYPDSELAAAICQLATAPDYTDHDPYTAVALAVRNAYPSLGQPTHGDPTGQLSRGGLALPTWLYGHEPANLFAGGIAKYFSNAIREDTILRLARGGVVFAPGQAGTVQEVFQAATKSFYATDGDGGPFIFLGTAFWAQLDAPALLRDLLAASPVGDLSNHVLVTDDVAEAVRLLSG
jgi:predicted Rossmann-fold nucleotide-binding protein